MKIRITRNSLRFRLRQPEVQALYQRRCMFEILELGDLPQQHLRFVLEAGTCAETTLNFESNTVSVRLPHAVADAWAKSDEVGIYERIRTSGGKTVEVTIEKDFACLDATAEENEGAYPNPKASCEIQPDEAAI